MAKPVIRVRAGSSSPDEHYDMGARMIAKAASDLRNAAGMFDEKAAVIAKAAEFGDKLDVDAEADVFNDRGSDGRVQGLNMGPSEKMSGSGSERMTRHYSNPTRQAGISADYEELADRLDGLEKAVSSIAAYLKGQPFPRSEDMTYTRKAEDDKSERVGEAGEDDTASEKAMARKVKRILSMIKAEDDDDEDGEDDGEDVEKSLRNNVLSVPQLLKNLADQAQGRQSKPEVNLAQAPDFSSYLVKGGADAEGRLVDAIDNLEGADHLEAITLKNRMVIGRSDPVAWNAFSTGLSKSRSGIICRRDIAFEA